MYGPTGQVPTERAHPLLYLLLVLVLANLAATTALWMRGDHATEEPSKPLPGYLNTETIATLADDVREHYNAASYEAWYELFDPLARMEFTEEDLRSQIEKLRPLIGEIDEFAYSHHEFGGTYSGHETLTLHYKLRLSGAEFTTGTLSITVVDRGDRAAVAGVHIQGQ